MASNLLKFMGLCFVSVAGTPATKCHDGDSKIDAISLKTGEREVSLFDDIEDKEKHYDESNQASCPEERGCFNYTVTATFTVVASKYPGELVSTELNDGHVTTGELDLAVQVCLDLSTDTDEMLTNNALCDNWKGKMKEVLGNLNIFVAYLKPHCSALSYCGDGCRKLKSNNAHGKIILQI